MKQPVKIAVKRVTWNLFSENLSVFRTDAEAVKENKNMWDYFYFFVQDKKSLRDHS